MSHKHKHRLLLHTSVSYVLVYPWSPLCATLPSHTISEPSCHTLRPMAPLYDHSPSPHLLGWTHGLCSALPCNAPRSGCPLPAISQPSLSPCLCLPMLFSPSLVSFPPENCSSVSLLSFIRCEAEVTQPAEEATGNVHGYVLPFFCIQCIRACPWLGLSSTAKGNPLSRTLFRHGDTWRAGL